MIHLEDVTKIYRVKDQKNIIIQNLTFTFPRDKNIAIIGRNGAGKSTVIRLLSGSELPDSGFIYREKELSWPLGFAGGFNGSMTGFENIRFVSRIYGQDSDRISEYVVDFSELGSALKLPIKNYSNGMRARLAFGLSMAINFQVYLIDEVVAVGDESFRKKCQKVFKQKAQDINLIVVSHNMNFIKEYCECGILIEAGQFIFFPNITDLIKAYKDLFKLCSK